MPKLFLFGLFLLMLSGAGLRAAENAAVGSWDVVSETDAGEQSNWKLVITQEGGKLGGTISGEPGDFTLEDVKVESDTLSFKVTIGDESYTTRAKIDGTKLDGSFEGSGMKGTVKGTKQS